MTEVLDQELLAQAEENVAARLEALKTEIAGLGKTYVSRTYVLAEYVRLKKAGERKRRKGRAT